MRRFSFRVRGWGGDETETEVNSSQQCNAKCSGFSRRGFVTCALLSRRRLCSSMCGGMCRMCGSCCHLLVRSSSPLGAPFPRRMLPYPVQIYFPTLGGDGTFVRVGVKTEFIALWLPPRMRNREDDGTQGRPALPEGTFAPAREEEGAPRVALTDVEPARNRPKLY